MKLNQPKAITVCSLFLRILASLAVLFFVIFKILIPYATNQEMDITSTDKHILGWSFVVMFALEVVIRAAKKRIEKKIGE